MEDKTKKKTKGQEPDQSQEAVDTKRGQLSATEIVHLKKKHGHVHHLTVRADEGEDLHAYLKEPDRKTIGAAMMKYNMKDPLGAGEVILMNCWLAGSDRIRNEDKYFIAAATTAMGLFELPEASIKKL